MLSWRLDSSLGRDSGLGLGPSRGSSGLLGSLAHHQALSVRQRHCGLCWGCRCGRYLQQALPDISGTGLAMLGFIL